MIESEIQRKILSSCTFFKDGAKYAELRILEIENDLYNYHLQKLVKDGYLEKSGTAYHITAKGKSFVTNVDELDLKIPPSYKVSVYLCPIMGNKILLTRRQKHPQFGYVGLVAEKKKYGELFTDTAKRALTEETGLHSEMFQFVGSLHQVRHDKAGNVIEDGVFYVFRTEDFAGQLVEKSLEGEYFWIDLDQISTLDKVFKPSLEVIAQEIIDRKSGAKNWEQKFFYEFEPEPEEY